MILPNENLQRNPAMSLLPCRACGHLVDLSALACPGCGATDPARKISRQQREMRNFLLQLVVAVTIFCAVGTYLWHQFMPIVKAAVVKQNAG